MKVHLMFRRIVFALGFVIAAISSPLAAQTAAEGEAASAELLRSRAAEPLEALAGRSDVNGVFTPSFLEAVPPAQLSAISAQLVSQFGTLQSVERVEPTGAHSARVSFRFEKAIGVGMMDLEPTKPHLVAGLQLSRFDPIDDSAEKIRADLASLPGAVSVWFGSLDGKQVHFEHNPDASLAIGSAFKLYVLSALTRQIGEGKLQWDTVVPLTRKSFPSGMMQDWPQGAPVTVQTLASLMISISDNTATDQLIEIVGRGAVEDEMQRSGHASAKANLPFLNTFELFALKGDQELAARYLAADQAGKRAVLVQLAEQSGNDPNRIAPPTFATPTAIDTLEWFASSQDLRKILQQIVDQNDPAAMAIMAISPSMGTEARGQWNYTGFKGGSEPGVLNLTWLVQDKNGTHRVLVMTTNNPDAVIAHPPFELLSQRVLALPR